MASHNQKGRSKGTPGGYVHLDGYMLDSDAWKALKPIARAVYIALKRRFRSRGKGKSNNGYISMSRREAASQTGFSESAMHNAFPDLIEKGFIKITRESAFNMKDARAREYSLTEFPVGDRLPTKDFLRWLPEKQNTGAPETPDGCVGNTRDTKPDNQKVHTVRSTGAPETPVTRGNGCAGRTTSNYHRDRH